MIKPDLEQPLQEPRSSATPSSVKDAALAMRVSIRRGRLFLLTVLAVAFVAALTLAFSHRGVVIETFDRRDKSVKDQEKLLEKYNSYSGTITSLVERPVEIFMSLAVQVVVLRLMANDALQVERRWRVGVAAIALGAGGTYLLSNGFSAVNVQVRELPIRSVISAGELALPAMDPRKTSTFDESYSELRPKNPATNTILRNLILARDIETRPACADRDTMDALDIVDYRIPQQPWMTYLLPEAVDVASMKIAIANTSVPDNDKLTPDRMPTNASIAADLLVYTTFLSAYGAWGDATGQLTNASLANKFFHEVPPANNDSVATSYGPTARLTGLLPPKDGATETEDREWFLRRVSATMFNNADPVMKNASLRSWTIELSHIDIVPGAVMVDAITIEREMATPRLQPNMSKDGKTGYFPLAYYNREASPMHISLPRAGDARDETIDIFSLCTDLDGNEVLTSRYDIANDATLMVCDKQSTHSLLILSRGKRIVADALILNTTVNNSAIVRGDGLYGVVVNMREIFSTTIAKLSWKVQDLSAVYNARCDASDGCMGIDVPLPGSGQRLVVNASSLPVSLASRPIQEGVNTKPQTILSVRRPQFFSRYRNEISDPFIGDIVMPHNIKNSSATPVPPTETCDYAQRSRVVSYVNNHVYMETTLQPTYTAAAYYLFKGGVVRDILNQSTPTHTVLVFNANIQDVDVYVFIPWLNVVLSLAGCVLLLLAIAAVMLWPQLYKRNGEDPLENITEPHMIANVMLNEDAYPPLLLSRAVADHGVSVGQANAEAFTIQSLSLHRKDVDDGHGAPTQMTSA